MCVCHPVVILSIPHALSVFLTVVPSRLGLMFLVLMAMMPALRLVLVLAMFVMVSSVSLIPVL